MEIHKNLDLEDLDGEIWKEIEGYDGYYFISNLGRVKSFKKWNGTDVRILEPQNNSCGYLYVDLCKNNEKKTKKIHILMYENHIEKIPEGYVVHHIDFTKDNFLNNFQLMTNEDHTRLHHKGKNHTGENNPNYGKHSLKKTLELMSESHIGKYPSEETLELMREKKKGENNPNSKIKNKDIIEIRKDLKEGILTQTEIGEKFSIDRTTISQIKTRKTWKHI